MSGAERLTTATGGAQFPPCREGPERLSQLSGGERFAGLDLLRGVAAASVLALHLHWPAGLREPLPRAYLAVDFFFLLSGFVIAHAYSERLGTAQLFKRFCLARLVRLYPVYCLATVLVAGEMLVFIRFGSSSVPNVTAGKLMSSLATALLLLPTPAGWSVEPASFFALVGVARSVFWELLVNLLYGMIVVLRRQAFIPLMILAGAVGIALSECLYGPFGVEHGPDWEGAWVGGARALLSFFMGVCLFGLRGRCRAPSLPALWLPPVLLLAFVPATFGGWPYEVICICLLFPALVWFGADARMCPRVCRAGIFLGLVSYPLYLLQGPLLLGLVPVGIRLERMVPSGGLLQFVSGASMVFLASCVVAIGFDLPVRDRLRRWLLPGAPVPQGQTAP